ncbi:Cys-tRNA(Pro) deacylase [Aidingimonas halophila]|uniref:Cys-tRNA(Pro)/Cys-tRNA(Cys) deacylase n=1 Tax=Aidingimonas halophila TaxID=574349 RepID=A0A1H2VX26_9GAMM|nr:Cys-tRNA(Pro) deacylase [Aidingimonas halophila]GHC24900.1 Cys-tRNA(Pro)/Cys-tRNA(Cys) deacylase [Aidingimonas halophila]SDW72801.1 Cys-tRNA(Pro)/Cys-tRNA(Cys) deacylase [Aidingimonas halophila]
MTPAVRQLTQAKVPFELKEYSHDPKTPAYGEEAVKALGLSADAVFKTLLARLEDGRLVVAILPVSRQLNLKALAKAASAKKATMAEPAEAERVTGYLVGGISPLGQKKALPTFIDNTVEQLDLVHVSGGRRGLEIALAPNDLKHLTKATLASLTQK